MATLHREDVAQAADTIRTRYRYPALSGYITRRDTVAAALLLAEHAERVLTDPRAVGAVMTHSLVIMAGGFSGETGCCHRALNTLAAPFDLTVSLGSVTCPGQSRHEQGIEAARDAVEGLPDVDRPAAWSAVEEALRAAGVEKP